MTEPSLTPYAKGVLGESRAANYLCEKGMILLKERYHSPFGEIDLILRDGDTLVFAEVKLRARGKAYDGLNAVSKGKQARMIQTARCYLSEQQEDCSVRFDVVEITADGIMHVKDAFQGREW